MLLKINGPKRYFWQWDLDRQLVVGDEVCGEVHFCNGTDDCALVCEVYQHAGLRLVNVPNILLQTAKPLTAYLYLKGRDGCLTRHQQTFQVVARTKPADYVYTETEVKSWAALEDRVKALEENGTGGSTGIGGGDWNATEGKAGHIKNRTHYVETALVEILPETTVSSGKNNFGVELALVEGETYKVIFNGEEQNILCEKARQNDNTAYMLWADAFVISVQYDYNGTFLESACNVFDKSVTGATISICHDGEVVHPLADKFIPKNIARKNDIPTSTSQLTNDSGFITADDIPKSTTHVTSVNGQTGDVQLTAENIPGVVKTSDVRSLVGAMGVYRPECEPRATTILLSWDQSSGYFVADGESMEKLAERAGNGEWSPEFFFVPPSFFESGTGEIAAGVIAGREHGAEAELVAYVVDFDIDGKTVRLRISADGIEEIPVPSAGIPLPPTAEVGQYFKVSAVDENGNVTAVEAVDAPSGGGTIENNNDWELINSLVIGEEGVTSFTIDTDANGEAFELSDMVLSSPSMRSLGGETASSARTQLFINGKLNKYSMGNLVSAARRFIVRATTINGRIWYGHTDFANNTAADAGVTLAPMQSNDGDLYNYAAITSVGINIFSPGTEYFAVGYELYLWGRRKK